MKIVIEDFVYYGHHFDRLEVNIPEKIDICDLESEEIVYEHIVNALSFERSFYPFKDEVDSV